MTWWIKRSLRDAASDDAGGTGGSGGAPAGGDSGAAAAGTAGTAVDTGAAAAVADKGSASGEASATGDKGVKASDGYWPADWRQTVSKEDAKVLTRLERYASPEAAMQALIAAQNRISAGELKPVLSKNPSADELKDWRTAHGIPETPDKYDLKDAKVSADDPLVKEVLKAAHATNQTPDQLKATIGAWNAYLAQASAERDTKDVEIRQAVDDQLHAEWGTEYRRNINLIHNLLDGNSDAKLKDALLGGRLADGTPIGSSADALKLLVSLALVQNPTGVVVPGGEGAQGEGLRDELEKIAKFRASNRKGYDKDDKMQARERTLLEAAMKSGHMDDNGNWKK